MKNFLLIIISILLGALCYHLFFITKVYNKALSEKGIRIINREAVMCVPFHAVPNFPKHYEIH